MGLPGCDLPLPIGNLNFFQICNVQAVQGAERLLLLQILSTWHSHQGCRLKCDAENETENGLDGKAALLSCRFSDEGNENDNKLNIKQSMVLTGVIARTLLTIIAPPTLQIPSLG